MTHDRHLHTYSSGHVQAPANLSPSVARDNLWGFAMARCQSAAVWRVWPSSTSNCSVLHKRQYPQPVTLSSPLDVVVVAKKYEERHGDVPRSCAYIFNMWLPLLSVGTTVPCEM